MHEARRIQLVLACAMRRWRGGEGRGWLRPAPPSLALRSSHTHSETHRQRVLACIPTLKAQGQGEGDRGLGLVLGCPFSHHPTTASSDHASPHRPTLPPLLLLLLTPRRRHHNLPLTILPPLPHHHHHYHRDVSQHPGLSTVHEQTTLLSYFPFPKSSTQVTSPPLPPSSAPCYEYEDQYQQ